MAYFGFYFVRKLAERVPMAVGDEDRIVSKTPSATRRVSDTAFANAFGGGEYFARRIGDDH
jgi:hypothetical protein